MKKKILLTVLILVSLVAFTQNIVFAGQPYDWKTQITTADGWKGDKNVMDVTKDVMGSAIKIIRTIATGIAIIMLTYVAIKYMVAAPSEKAEFKKTATAFVVGAIVLFASSGILTIISNFASKNITLPNG